MDGYIAHLVDNIVPLAIAFGAVWAYNLAFHLFADFRYRTTDRIIEMRWIALRLVQVSRRAIELDQVEGAAVASLWRCLWAGRGFHLFGNMFARRGAVITLKKGVLWFSFGRIIYVTPPNPEAFVAEVTSALGAASGTR